MTGQSRSPDVEFFLFMHAFQPVATSLHQQFGCMNGRAYAGNTPTLEAKVGQRVAFHVISLDNDFHTFHIHGHRWTDPDGTVIDTRTFGPGESYTLEFVEDNPGRWFYHCHVFSHLHMRDERLVHRALSPRRRLGLGAVALVIAALALGAATASAANRRVAIGHYQWSRAADPPRPRRARDLVLGRARHAALGDRNLAKRRRLGLRPRSDQPRHDLGDTYQLTFNQPGTYTFQCKLHSSVRGSVVVSDVRGNPSEEVDPVPKFNVDVTPPHLNDVKLGSRRFGRHGTKLKWGVNEKAKLDAEYYEIRHGRRGKFAGWNRWKGHVGYNDAKFGGHSRHFDARPGRYVAVIQATDESHNTGKKRTRRFKIR